MKIEFTKCDLNNDYSLLLTIGNAHDGNTPPLSLIFDGMRKFIVTGSSKEKQKILKQKNFKDLMNN